MTLGQSYQAVMARRGEIVVRSVGLDYAKYARGDYDHLLMDAGYGIKESREVQR